MHFFSLGLLSVVAVSQGRAAMCGYTGLPDADRQLIVDKHNNYRSELAQGLSKMKNGVKAPPAKNMKTMKYSCTLEKIAQKWADRCEFAHSPSEMRKAGENLYMTTDIAATVTDSFTEAAALWWKELADYGSFAPNNVTFTMAKFNTGIGHWSQMAWADTSLIGCGIKRCVPQKMTMVVCNYRAIGNYLNHDIYEIGMPCFSEGACKCDQGTKLCV